MTANITPVQSKPEFDCPLIVDLDGTLIRTDMLHESALNMLRDKPLHALLIPFYLLQGKAALKRQLANHPNFDAGSLPYNHALLDWLKQQKSQGRKIILCTASDISTANAISEHLGVFDEVIASDGEKNMAGKHKAEILTKRFGQAGFDYAGNSCTDMAVWKKARRGVVVNASKKVMQRAESVCTIEQVFSSDRLGLAAFLKVLRIHQWLKNLLLLVPLLAAHQITHIGSWVNLIYAFFSFSLCASSVYIANDLFDLESDRQHPRKHDRPFASGRVPVWMGVALTPLLTLCGLLLAQHVSNNFAVWLLFYLALSCAYTWFLKRLLLVDCLALAVLYTLRIVAGAAAVNVMLSFWLLAFSIFLFLSLAFVKRYAELQAQHLNGKEKAHGRGYYTSDAPFIQMLGIASGYVSILVLALYINSVNAAKLYGTPEFIWAAVPLMLLWISWMWMQAHRGVMHNDPIVFALNDKSSLVIALCLITVFILANPW